MTLDIHRLYPGVALVVTKQGSVLLGAPADAFKATKAYCQKHSLPFPRVLVSPQRVILDANPQFAPEFFLYDFLFVYGQAFKPELAEQRLQLVLDSNQVQDVRSSLDITLTGPSRAEMSAYKDERGRAIMDAPTIDFLASVSEHLAIKKGDRPRVLDDMIETPTFDRQGTAVVLDGAVVLQRTGPISFLVKSGGKHEEVTLSIQPPVIPFATLPVPDRAQTPMAFGIKAIGTRSGFDLSGPTTGFLIWVNGRAVVYDGPVGTRYLLERQGISLNDIDSVVLSHCHEDHMGAFLELILAGQRPKVYTAEPVFRSLLIKLAGYFQEPQEKVATYIDYHRITPGEPVSILGASFDFFYTVHAIPTIGMAVSMRSPGGKLHKVQISGDTMHHDGLAKMRDANVIDKDTYQRMHELIPNAKVDGGLFLADVGEAIIHGHPKDWQDNPNHILYYHCPDNDHTRSFGQEIAAPGQVYPMIDSPSLHPSTPGRLLQALRFLDLRDPGWLSNILFRGNTRQVPAEEILFQKGSNGSNKLSVIVSGSASVSDSEGSPITVLRPGEFFGVIELVDKDGRQTATVKAETPMELFDVDAELFYDYVHSVGLDEALKRIWSQRPMVESATLFRRLELPVRNQIAALGVEARHRQGEAIIEQGTMGDDFFLVADGKVAIEVGGKTVREIAANDEDNFFGEISAVFPNRPRSATVRAIKACRTLRVRGPQIRKLFEGDMGVRYALAVAIKQRGG